MRRCRIMRTLLTCERGSSLVLTLIISTLLFILVTIAVHFSNTELKGASKQKEQTCAYYTAEAGLDRTVHEINRLLAQHQAPAIIAQTASMPDTAFQQGFFSVQVSERLNNKGEPVGYTIVSKGSCSDEEKTITAWVRQPVWPGDGGNIPKALQFAVYAEQDLKLRTLSGLLGLGILSTHPIQIDGDFHGNDWVEVRHDYLLLPPPPPIINGYASSTELNRIQVDGLDAAKKKVYAPISMPEFDFDAARKKAQKEGIYVPGNVLDISVLGLSPTDKIIFIDGDLTLTGLDLLGISLMDRTIIVTGTVTGLLEVGGLGLINTNLNLIARENINFFGAITGLQVDGVLFAQGDISVEGHAEVKGYTGGKNIDVGSGILSSLLGLITGSMHFEYDLTALQSIPSGVGFKSDFVEVVELKE